MGKLSRIVFFGTPDFAVPSLEALVDAGHAPQLVVTQPPRPVGRGGEVQEGAVATRARELGLEVEQPEKVRAEDFVDRMRELKPDLFVVAAFGQIFPEELLEVPKLGAINVHGSLLPKYRGAAPIQAAIANGEKKTGVTIMKMVYELDAGPILAQQELEIGKRETAGALFDRMAPAGAELLMEVVDKLDKKGKVVENKQKDEQATYAGRLTKRDGKINWALPAQDVFNRLRAMTPWPGMEARIKGRPVKIIWAVPVTWEDVPDGPVGTYLGMRQGRLVVVCGGGTLLGIERLQRPGKTVLSAADFANGERLNVAQMFA